jgi:hypothetical protein
MPIDRQEKPSDVERWADMRAQSEVRNRVAFLWTTGIFAIVFGALALDIALDRGAPDAKNFFGLSPKDASEFLKVAAPMAIASAIGHGLIRRFWKRT